MVESMLTAEQCLKRLPQSYQYRVNERREELKRWFSSGALPKDIIEDAHILDWEGGDCAFAYAFLLEGAKKAFAIDSWMDIASLPEDLKRVEGLAYAKMSINDLDNDHMLSHSSQKKFDLVFANTVTEHMPNLGDDITILAKYIRQGGYFFNNHDNYYQPCGSHDHGFLFYGEDNKIVSQGIDCWNSLEKCKSSVEHREDIKSRLPWTWDGEIELQLSPENCNNCPYYKRQQPWAHLLYQKEFRNVFMQKSFWGGNESSTLNKVSIYQLRQFMIEAGFNVINEKRHIINNLPPKQLLNEPYHLNEQDLRTSTIAMLAIKGDFNSSMTKNFGD